MFHETPILASRYIVLDHEFNNDGAFGEVMVAWDLEGKTYVAIKRCKEIGSFGQLINEIRTQLYINCHDRINNYRHFGLM